MGLTWRGWVFWVNSSWVKAAACCGVGTAVDIDEAIMHEELVVVIPILLISAPAKSKLLLLERMWKTLKALKVDFLSISCDVQVYWVEL